MNERWDSGGIREGGNRHVCGKLAISRNIDWSILHTSCDLNNSPTDKHDFVRLICARFRYSSIRIRAKPLENNIRSNCKILDVRLVFQQCLNILENRNKRYRGNILIIMVHINYR